MPKGPIARSTAAALVVALLSASVAVYEYREARPFLYPEGFSRLGTFAEGDFAIVDRPLSFSLFSRFTKDYRVILRIDGCVSAFLEGGIDRSRDAYDMACGVTRDGKEVSFKSFDSGYPLLKPTGPDCTVVVAEFEGERGGTYDVEFLFRGHQEAVKAFDRLNKELWVEESFPDYAVSDARMMLFSIAMLVVSIVFLGVKSARAIIRSRAKTKGMSS